MSQPLSLITTFAHFTLEALWFCLIYSFWLFGFLNGSNPMSVSLGFVQWLTVVSPVIFVVMKIKKHRVDDTVKYMVMLLLGFVFGIVLVIGASKLFWMLL